MEKYLCMADLLFDWFGFGQTSKSFDSFNKTKQVNPTNQTGCHLYSDTSPYKVSE